MNKFWLLIVLFQCLAINASAQTLTPVTKKGAHFYVNSNGKKISKEKFDDAFEFSEGLGRVGRNDKWGFVNESVEFEIPIRYDKAWDFVDGAAVVQLNAEHYLINKNEEIISERYDSIIVTEEFVFVELNNKIGILKRSGEILEELTYDGIGNMYKNKIALKKNGAWGNWSNGIFDASDNKIYVRKPDTPPVFSLECTLEPDPELVAKCSSRKMIETVYRNISYPAEARKNGVEGTVVVQYVINTDGEIEDVELARDIGAGCGEETLRMVNEYMTTWARPGIHNGEMVNTVFYHPIRFRLE